MSIPHEDVEGLRIILKAERVKNARITFKIYLVVGFLLQTAVLLFCMVNIEIGRDPKLTHFALVMAIAIPIALAMKTYSTCKKLINGVIEVPTEDNYKWHWLVIIGAYALTKSLL